MPVPTFCFHAKILDNYGQLLFVHATILTLQCFHSFSLEEGLCSVFTPFHWKRTGGMCAHMHHPSVSKRPSASTEQLGRNVPKTARWFPTWSILRLPPSQLFPFAYLALVSTVQERVHLAAQPQRTELLNRQELSWWCRKRTETGREKTG